MIPRLAGGWAANVFNEQLLEAFPTIMGRKRELNDMLNQQPPSVLKVVNIRFWRGQQHIVTDPISSFYLYQQEVLQIGLEKEFTLNYVVGCIPPICHLQNMIS